MNLFSHQGVNHQTNLEAAGHILTSSILMWAAIGLLLGSMLIIGRRINAVERIKSSIKRKDS